MLLQRALRLGLLRRSMATAPKEEFTGKELTPIQQVGVFTAIFVGVLGPGIMLMLFRERPLSEH